MARAIETDPLSGVAHWHVGYVNMILRHYDTAIAALEKLVILDPSYGPAYPILFQLYFLKGDETRSFEVRTNRVNSAAWRTTLENAYRTQGIRGVFAAEAEEEIRLRGQWRVRAYRIAERLAVSGDTERALQFLELAYVNRSIGLSVIAAHPLFASLRAEPRFQALVKKVGFNK
ncbi:MAG: hypothetical protein EXS36_14210 [Pedosphaera sp.]|nr:hypothetical protein [Pedosphaera sp.]